MAPGPQQPTIGRIVLYQPAADSVHKGPMPAIISRVHYGSAGRAGAVDLMTFPPGNLPQPREAVLRESAEQLAAGKWMTDTWAWPQDAAVMPGAMHGQTQDAEALDRARATGFSR